MTESEGIEIFKMHDCTVYNVLSFPKSHRSQVFRKGQAGGPGTRASGASITKKPETWPEHERIRGKSK